VKILKVKVARGDKVSLEGYRYEPLSPYLEMEAEVSEGEDYELVLKKLTSLVNDGWEYVAQQQIESFIEARK
jgi:hypothetical protein